MLRGKPNNAKRRVERHKEESQTVQGGEPMKRRIDQYEEELSAARKGEPSNVKREKKTTQRG
jgi:hypothetical protein